MKFTNSAFTLIELSIVIVIVSLIVAGVLSGQALVRQASLQTLITESSSIRTAMNAFTLKYNAIPGDFNEAALYWDDTECNSNDASECNGDGNGKIASYPPTANDADDVETYRAWRHLNQAGFFPGSYTGLASGSNAAGGVANVSIPASRFSGVAITLLYEDDNNLGPVASTGAANRYADVTLINASNNLILFGKDNSSAPVLANIPFVSPADARSIEKKADDGEPLTGALYAVGSSGSEGCVDNSRYNVGYEELVCALAFKF